MTETTHSPEPAAAPPAPPDPRGKKWLLLQIFGGFVAVAGILWTTYFFAQLQQAGKPFQIPPAAGLLLVGVAIHVAGRVGLRRLNR